MARETHLFVVCHGLWGKASHVQSICDAIHEQHARLAAGDDDAEAIDLRVLAARSYEWVRAAFPFSFAVLR